MKTHILGSILAIGLLAGCGDKDTPSGPVIKDNQGGSKTSVIEVGKTVPAWQKGEMDIHFINTTTGECLFVIFPDGTQMLIDAASADITTNTNGSSTNTGIRSRWDPTKTGLRGSQIIGTYLRNCMQWTGNKNIDYAVLTHLHGDHFGSTNSSLPKSSNSSTYYKTGMAEILDDFPVTSLLDRGYPSYNYPFDMATMASNAADCRSYINAVKWHVANKGLKAAMFKPGASDQIVLRNPAEYPTVKVQNIAATGEIWTGVGNTTVKTFPELSGLSYANSKDIKTTEACPEENITSCVMKISYGKFDFFTGGDLQYNGKSYHPWKDIETPCASVCGQVEVMKANHHGSNATHSADALNALRSLVHVTCSWVDVQPRSNTLSTILKNLPDCKLYITNFWRGERPAGADTKVPEADANKVAGYDGHVLVRVTDGGAKFRVAMLTDSDGKMTVKSVSEPISSR